MDRIGSASLNHVMEIAAALGTRGVALCEQEEPEAIRVYERGIHHRRIRDQ